MRNLMYATLIVVSLLFTMCRHHISYDDVVRPYTEQQEISRLAQLDTLKWAQFIECSADQGDLGCDSCFTMIYGFSLEFK